MNYLFLREIGEQDEHEEGTPGQFVDTLYYAVLAHLGTDVVRHNASQLSAA
jgi:hypothetical protein